MTLTQLGYVVAVDTHRNFVEAARRCHVSQPTLSMQIKKLEEELGVLLFDRGRQPVVPTQFGETLIVQARVVLREAARLEEQVREARGEVQGEYRLGIIPTLSATVLPLFLHPFTVRYPRARLVIREVQTEVMMELLARDELDGGIAATPLGSAELAERPMFYEPFYLYVSPAHPLAARKRVREADLLHQDVWLLSEGHCFRNQVVALCGLRPEERGQASLRFESGNLQTLIRLVEQHFGMTLLPHLVVREFAEGPRRARVRPFDPPVPLREVSLVTHREQVKARLSQAIFEEITAALPEELKGGRDPAGRLLPPL